MRPECVVLDLVLLWQQPGFLLRGEQFDIQGVIPQSAVERLHEWSGPG
jgi:hypothetical protein